MKKLSVLFLSLVAMATVTSCSKDSATTTPAATALELTVKNNVGVAVSGATVNLYSDSANKNLIGTAISDATGKVTFNKDLKAIVYYFDIVKDCNTNFFTGDYQTASLTANQTVKMDAKIAATAHVTVTNTSTTNMWAVELDNGTTVTPLFPIQKATDTTTPYVVTVPMPAGGAYKIVMTELTPTAKAYTDVTGTTLKKDENFACGDNDAITVPSN